MKSVIIALLLLCAFAMAYEAYTLQEDADRRLAHDNYFMQRKYYCGDECVREKGPYYCRTMCRNYSGFLGGN
jgi:hypothetical protein